MGEKEILDLVRRDGEDLPVSVRIVPFLEQPTIDKDLHSANFQKVA